MAYVPPLDPLTAKDNPRLKSLYTSLSSTVLNEDGSVKIPNDHAERQASTKMLQTLIILIASPLIPTDESRLSSFLFASAIDPSPLGQIVSPELSELNGQLLYIANPMTKGCTTDDISARKSELEKSKRRLHNERLGLASAVATILELRQDIIATSIQALESVKHGSISRADTAETAYYAMAAKGLDEKLRIMKLEALQSIYAPEAKDAIRTYQDHLARLKMRLKAREREAIERLGQYDAVGRSMGQIAERYVGLVQEVESVQAQIQRFDS